MFDAPSCPPQKLSTPPAAPHGLGLRCLARILPIALILLSGNVAAQGTPLKPPSAFPSAPASSGLRPPAPATPATALSAPAATKSAPVATPSAALTRFKVVKVDGKLVDLRTLPDATVLKGKSGQTISVARIKQLQARLDGASAKPMITAQKGQSLKTLASAPSGTLIALPGGRVTRSQNLAQIQGVMARLKVKRVVRPIPVSLNNAQPTAVVGQGLTLADALKRPASDVIQIGSRKFTAEQLRQMDALLKASPRDPRGLLERAGTASAAGQPGRSPNAPRAPLTRQLPTDQSPASTIRKGAGK
jgi:hypothetical protein